MTPNVELLDRTLAHVESHESEWNQAVWRCKTGMCFAGWACELSGGQWAYPVDDEDHDTDLLVAEPEDEEWTVCDGLVDVVDRALRVLRLKTSRGLFNSENTLDDLRRIVADIKAAQ